MTTYTPEEQAIYDRNTYRGPLPTRTEPPKAPEPKRHALAGKTPGVRSTSRQALKSIESKLGPKQMEVMNLLRQAKRPVNDREIMHGLNAQLKPGDRPWEITDVNGRRKELVDMGKVEEYTRKVNPETGKRVIYWRAVEAQG